ncbi:hypothetical protein [Aquipseudomonas ullengensis]|uniref:Uncharacterized protein n=1 Tax=Aquipseudomonas ullengensis TaxID=2759166 RepID=A0A7W4QBJ6_9GAMM|nr:hypothetical protein [Pseudomonas ullengensis]MBB2496530.1 hypothetical protein [Pseudomonas ullengensis]
MLQLLRALPPRHRGLNASESTERWGMDRDYRDNGRAAARRALRGLW